MRSKRFSNDGYNLYSGFVGNEIEAAARELSFLRCIYKSGRSVAQNMRALNDKKILAATYRCIHRAAQNSTELSAAAESIMERYYIIEKTLISVEDFDKEIRSSVSVPVVCEGEMAGMPRVYSIAYHMLSHGNYRFSENMLISFLNEFQKTSPLESCELAWLSKSLSIACIRKLCAISVSVVGTIVQYENAEHTYEQIRRNTTSLRRRREYVREFLKTGESAGISHLHALLTGSDDFEMIAYMNSLLSLQNKTVEGENAICRQRNKNESAQINAIIGVLRALDETDWEKLIQTLSVVNDYLERDAIYVRMDLTSKRKYRQAVSSIAVNTRVSEAVVAMRACELAKNAEGKRGHVGYYLLYEEGINELISALNPNRKKKLRSQKYKLTLFIATQALFAVALILLALLDGIWQGLLSVLPAWAIANACVVRWYVMHTKPAFIPRLNINNIAPEDITTMVVVPTLITGSESISSVMSQLETHYLSNPLECCVFVLLSDFSDSMSQSNEGDRTLLLETKKQVERLNRKYASNNTSRFFCFHRERTMNKNDGIYMGRERKRGAIEDLLRLIKANERGSFTLITDKLPDDIKYMVVLDSDTIMPRDSLKALIGAMAHPMNAPEADAVGIVRKGYGIIAPRMETTPKSAANTSFSRIVSGFCGISAYSDTVADIYQDTFDESIFSGKGIINIDAFYNALNYRIQDNTVLSHDMLEGCFARAGYMSDVTLYDGEPSSFFAWWRRQHRWIRGDWQLLPFLPSYTKDVSGSKHKTFINPLSRFKIFDNMRRSLLPPAVLITLLASVFWGVGFYTILSLIALFIEPVISSLLLLIKCKDGGLRGLRDQGYAWTNALLHFAALPYETLKTLDAVCRTIYRVLFSHKNMLQWQTAAQGEKQKCKTLSGYIRLMWFNWAAGLLALSASFFGFHSLIVSGILWIIAPIACYFLDKPVKRAVISDDDKRELIEQASRIWRFFYDLSKPEYGYCPPDNFQETPFKPPVYNASPTNIGMGLMASICAYDMGFIAADELIKRLNGACSYMESLEKWNGHLFNWYDIKTRKKLDPAYVSTVDSGNLAACLLLAAQTALELDGTAANECAKRLRKLALDMDFPALYDNKKSLFHIGFDYHNGVLSRSWYDLLASEARLTYLVACALNQTPQKSWSSLGRLLVKTEGGRALISWGGTMFEYLMPVIFTRIVPGTLMEETANAVLAAQKYYMSRRGKPWGISESGYYVFDRNMYYQYRAFGVPRLGLCPMRETEMVTAPYASALALMVDTKTALENLRAFAGISACGKYGYYEAVDFTPGRVASPGGFEIVRSYMAHHQGMSLCAINNVLNDFTLQKRFESIPEIKTVELLTQERVPSSAVTLKEYERSVYNDDSDSVGKPKDRVRVIRSFSDLPEGQLITNGEYTVFMCDNGTGFSKCKDIMLNRFRPDYMRETAGVSVYLKHDGKVFGLNPAVNDAASEDACTVFEQHKIELSKRVDDISLKASICVSPDYNGEVRRITVINHSSMQKDVELGIFADISLARQDEDVAHPAFVRLTVDATLEGDTVLYKRRGTKHRNPYYMYACLSGPKKPRYCTDRLIFPGRGQTCAESMMRPILPNEDLSSPIEPGLCARSEITLKPGESAEFVFAMGFAQSRERALFECNELLSGDVGHIVDMSWAKANSALRFMGISYGKAELFERILTHILLNIPQKSADIKVMPHKLDELHRLGIGNQHPIILFRIQSQTKLRLVKTLLKLQEYAAYKGCTFELVIVGEYPNEYVNDLKVTLTDMITAALERFSMASRRNHIHLLDGYSLTENDMNMLERVALIVIDPSRTPDRQFAPGKFISPLEKDFPDAFERRPAFTIERPELLFDNGLGGFDPESGEYVIMLRKDMKTPLPWSNIICNEGFGTVVTESGGGYTFKGNAHDSRLTPWYNDAISDKRGENILLSDENSGDTWTITPSRIQGQGEVLIRHGSGYTSFRSANSQLHQILTVFVDDAAPVKYWRLSIKNPVMETRRISIMYMVDWNIGEAEAVTWFKDNVLYASSCFDAEPMFATIIGDREDDGEIEYSGDRRTTLNGGWIHRHLNCATGAGLGSFGALRMTITIHPGESRELAIIMGKATAPEIEKLTHTMTLNLIDDTLNRVKRMWLERTGGITVKTPDLAINTLFNSKLLYQVYASRLMGRTGYYQSGGAYGFRDQLQDVLALLYTNPQKAKGQILLCASMQFEAGDVLHWWHTPSRGVRTYINDDRLFLPYVVTRYLRVTGDHDILNESVPYLKDVSIPEGKRDIYFEAEHTNYCERLYNHCLRAINKSLEFGTHGLPLMAGGDWNDGMDCVGDNGGESVFLAFLLQVVIRDMLPIIKHRGDIEEYKRLSKIQRSLKAAVEETGWDGQWYLRAYYGNGETMGSHNNTECSVDLLSQVWAVFANADNAYEAYNNAISMLMDRQNGVISLLMPPFYGRDDSVENRPGYIEAYVPGTRENGGQYTHAAVWSVIAACMLGCDELAMDELKLINPIEKTAHNEGMLRYKGEPYVIAGDVYTIGKNASRAGWTWYTGSAAWMYVAILEYIIGFNKRGNSVTFKPHATWDEFEISYKYADTRYLIRLISSDETFIEVDGERFNTETLELLNDKKTHRVLVGFVRKGT